MTRDMRRLRRIDWVLLTLMIVFAGVAIVRVVFADDDTVTEVADVVSSASFLVFLVIFWLKTTPDKPGKHRDTGSEE